MKQVIDINTLDKVELNKGAIYWQYYRNTKLLDLDKERKIYYYRYLFSDESLLKQLLQKVYPEIENIKKIQDLIYDMFFDKDIINNYKKCALPDYHIMVFHFLINAITDVISPPKNFVHNAKSLKSNIMKIMDIEPIINSMVDEKFNRLLKYHNNIIDQVESDLVSQLTNYVDFEKHYSVTSKV